MKIDQLDRSFREYEELFMSFSTQYQLPPKWFDKPDHFAIKCQGADDYEETLETIFQELGPLEEIGEVTMDGRRLASARFSGQVGLGALSFRWVEIMEPKEGKAPPVSFVEHTEFTFVDTYSAEHGLMLRGIDYELQANPGHSWININMDPSREIKLNDKPLAEVVVEEREQGKMRELFIPDNVVNLRPEG